MHSDTEHILHYVKKELVTFMVYDGVIYTAIKGDYSLIASSLSSHKVPLIFILLLQHKAVKKMKSAIRLIKLKSRKVSCVKKQTRPHFRLNPQLRLLQRTQFIYTSQPLLCDLCKKKKKKKTAGRTRFEKISRSQTSVKMFLKNGPDSRICSYFLS